MRRCSDGVNHACSRANDRLLHYLVVNECNLDTPAKIDKYRRMIIEKIYEFHKIEHGWRWSIFENRTGKKIDPVAIVDTVELVNRYFDTGMYLCGASPCKNGEIEFFFDTNDYDYTILIGSESYKIMKYSKGKYKKAVTVKSVDTLQEVINDSNLRSL